MSYYKRIEKILAEVKEGEADALMTEPDKLKKYGPVINTFKSKSNPNKTYEVRKQKGEDPTCNCPAWANRRTCRHVDEVKHMHPAVATAGVDSRQLSPKDAVADLLSRYFEKRAEAVAASVEKYKVTAISMKDAAKQLGLDTNKVDFAIPQDFLNDMLKLYPTNEDIHWAGVWSYEEKGSTFGAPRPLTKHAQEMLKKYNAHYKTKYPTNQKVIDDDNM